MGRDEQWRTTGTSASADGEEDVSARAASFDDRIARYQAIFESLAEGILVIGDDGQILEVNQAAIDRLGFTRDEFLQMHHTDLGVDTPMEKRSARVRDVLGGQAVSDTVCMYRKDGSSFPAEVAGAPGEADGKPALILSFRDITKRRKAEEARRESEERYRKLSEAGSEGIGVTQDGVIVDVNQRLADTLGYTMDEMIGRPALEFIAPDYRELVAHNMGSGYEVPYEADFLHKDGSRIRIGGRGVATIWNGREARVSALRDLTEARRMEAELAEQRLEVARIHKLAMLSEVSTGVIHQVSQPLNAIGNNVAAARMALHDSDHQNPGALATLESAEQDLKRLRQIIKRLRALAHPDPQNRIMLDLNEVVQEAIGLAGNAARRGGVRFETSLAPELPRVRGDAVQLGQAVLNLLHNAIDALASCVPDRRQIGIITRALKGEKVEVRVQDDGPGIPSKVQSRLFDPLFTTKPEGMGIGLSLTQTIVVDHGGRVEGCNNDDGPGATFRIVLPSSGNTA